MTDEELETAVTWYVNRWELYVRERLDTLDEHERELAEWKEMRHCILASLEFSHMPKDFTTGDVRRALFIASERIVVRRVVDRLKGNGPNGRNGPTGGSFWTDGGIPVYAVHDSIIVQVSPEK